MPFFFSSVFVIYAAINFYIFRKIFVLLKSKTAKTAYTTAFILVFASFPVAMLGRDSMPLSILKPMYSLGCAWLGIMIYLLLGFAISDLVLLPFKNIKKKIGVHRVAFVYITVLLLAVYGYINFCNPKVIRNDIVIEKTGGKRHKLTIVAISDLHLGMGIGKSRLKGYVELINAQKPDLVLIGGDLVDNTVRPLAEERMDEELRMIDAPLGVYACMGNHEYMGDVEACKNFYQKAGINLLIDEAALIDSSLWIIGRDDFQRGKSDRLPLKQIVNQISDSLPIIVLDHEPNNLEEAADLNIDLQFSGHTHNGQIFPGNLFAKGVFELPTGFKVKGRSHFFVSSGLGLWGPLMRIGTDSDIAVFKINIPYLMHSK